MSLDWFNQATQKEKEQFKSVCNQLLSRTYVVRMNLQPGKGRINNPDYTFIATHFEAIRDYLYWLDWDLRRDDVNGFFYVVNADDANRCSLTKKETAILLALRLIYDESLNQLGMEQDARCTVRELLEKVVTNYGILPPKPNMDEVKRALSIFENHSIIQRVEGKFNKTECVFVILPTVMAVIPAADLQELVSMLKKEEEEDEKAQEDSAD